MAKHRDRIGIIADVLKAAGEGTRKTRIMRTANLSYGLLRKYLDEAVGLGYLRLSQEMYQVTEDGEAFLKKHSEYSKKYSKVGKEMENMKLEKEELTKTCTNNRVDKSGQLG
jgi:predicted transcriptional regulator